MPVISNFLGIVIAIYHNDHEPPHLHAIYGDYEITIDLESGTVSGHFPRRALALVLEWFELHKVEARDDWTLARERKPLKTIDALE
ncbi:DUF4160 domain-containing protein [Myxococcota bacterium]|nr:DUF4160 domain-containing protein [Myxococcota bacterium]